MQKVPLLNCVKLRPGSFKSRSDGGLFFTAYIVIIRQGCWPSFKMSSGLNRPLQCGEFRQIWRQQRGKNIPPNSLINFLSLIVWTQLLDKEHLYNMEKGVNTKYCDIAKQNPEKWKIPTKEINAPSVIMHLLVQTFWEHIWKYTVDKSQINANSVTLQPLKQPIWRDIWKCTVAKGKTNTTNVTDTRNLRIHLKTHKTNATNVTLHPLGKAIWGDIWNEQWGKNQTNATSVAIYSLRQATWEGIW